MADPQDPTYQWLIKRLDSDPDAVADYLKGLVRQDPQMVAKADEEDAKLAAQFGANVKPQASHRIGLYLNLIQQSPMWTNGRSPVEYDHYTKSIAPFAKHMTGTPATGAALAKAFGGQALDSFLLNAPSSKGWLSSYQDLPPGTETMGALGSIAGNLGQGAILGAVTGGLGPAVQGGSWALRALKSALGIRGAISALATAQEAGRMSSEAAHGRQYTPGERIAYPLAQGASQFAWGIPKYTQIAKAPGFRNWAQRAGGGLLSHIARPLGEAGTTLGLMNLADQRPLMMGMAEGGLPAVALNVAAMKFSGRPATVNTPVQTPGRPGINLLNPSVTPETAGPRRTLRASERGIRLGMPALTPEEAVKLPKTRKFGPSARVPNQAPGEPAPKRAAVNVALGGQPTPAPAAPAAPTPISTARRLTAQDEAIRQDTEARRLLEFIEAKDPKDIPGTVYVDPEGREYIAQVMRGTGTGKVPQTILVDASNSLYEGTKDGLAVLQRRYPFKDRQGVEFYTENLDPDWLPIRGVGNRGVQGPLTPTAGAKPVGWTAYAYLPAKKTADGTLANPGQVWVRNDAGETDILSVADLPEEFQQKLAQLTDKGKLPEASTGIRPFEGRTLNDISFAQYIRALERGYQPIPELEKKFADKLQAVRKKGRAVQVSLGGKAVRRPRPPASGSTEPGGPSPTRPNEFL